MSLNCKFSCSNGKLRGGLKLKKGNDHLSGSNWIGKWRRKLLCISVLGVTLILSIWILLSLYDVIPKPLDSCEGNARILMRRFNVSKSQLHALASLISESDEIESLQCTKDPGTDMLLTDTVKVLFSEEQDLQKQHKLVAEYIEFSDRCLIRDENMPTNFDLSLSEDKSVLVSPQYSFSLVPTSHRIGGKRILQSRALGYCAEKRCESFFSLGKGCLWVLAGVMLGQKMSGCRLKLLRNQKQKLVQSRVQKQPVNGKWRKKLLRIFVLLGIIISIWLFWHLNNKIISRRVETLANMCDERARMLQDQFNVSLNHVHALAILVSTFHHGKEPSAIDQKTFGEYTERTAFERPLTSGVAYALKVTHSEREQFEKKHGWTIKKMGDQTLVQDCIPENLDPVPVQDEYAPVIFSQETVSHIVSIDMMSGNEDRENILRAGASGKGVLTSPFKLLKSNHLGVVLTFAVYNTDLPPDATPEQRTEAAVGYLGASYDIPSLVEKLLHQLASKQTIYVHVYDTTNASDPIKMYGSDVTDTGLLHISNVDFGDPLRKHEMHCRFKQKPPLPWTAINASVGVLVITLLVGHIFHAAISRIAKVENDYREMMELKVRAEAADVAKSQFLATVSHEIRTPMNGVLGMLQMLMDTDLDSKQLDYARTAYDSGKDLISLINEVLDQAKIESGRLELEAVPFDLRAVLDNVLSLFSGKSNEKGIELAVYVSKLVPEVVIGDPGRFQQIITNLVGNSIKFTHDKGHMFVSVHLADEVRGPLDNMDKVLRQGLDLVQDTSNKNCNTLSGFPVVDRWKSWENFNNFSTKNTNEEPEMIKLLVTVEDTGIGIPLNAQSRIFTPFMQADSSTSRTYGGTGIGLSISKRLVDLMGGEIGFVSEPERGSTFSFTGSFRKGVESFVDTKQYDLSVTEFRGLRALIIDNRSIRAEVTKYHLLRMGISVDIALSLGSSSSYLYGASNTSPSVNLSMILVDKDVWDEAKGLIFHALKENSMNTPKIFILATSISPHEQEDPKSFGYINILMKPLRFSVLIGCFQEALGSGKKRQDYRKKPSSLGSLLREKQILVVDDNAVNRRVAEGALKKYGAIVKCVESGKAALSMLTPPHLFDACFMDLQMPEMDGFEATRQIRSIESEVNESIVYGKVSIETFRNVTNWHTPILAMTADLIQGTNEECMKCGMDGYVSKPFDKEQLYSAVACFFESDQSRKDTESGYS